MNQLGYGAFENKHRLWLEGEANRLSHLQTRPALMVDTLVGYLRERRIELPPYNTFREIIADALVSFGAHLQVVIEQHLDDQHKTMLDALLENTTKTEPNSPVSRYPLTRVDVS